MNLPDGRIQTVNYHANDIDGYVAKVSYSGEAVYPDTPATHPVSHAVAHPAQIAHSLAHPAIAHHAIAHPIAHAVAHPIAHAATHTLAHPITHASVHPIAHAVSLPVVAHSVVSKDPMAKPAKKEEESGDGEAMPEEAEDDSA